jgi:hypothetical protein
MYPLKGRKRHSQQYSNSIVVVAVPRSNRLKLSLAGTAAVALASMALAVSPASAARVTEATTSSIRVMDESSNAQQFNLGNLGAQGSSTGLVAKRTRPYPDYPGNPLRDLVLILVGWYCGIVKCS